MSSSKRLFSLNPSFHHYVALSTGVFAILAGILHYIISGWCNHPLRILTLRLTGLLTIGRADPLHCNSLLTRGTWLDENHRNWQPEGMLSVAQTSIAVLTLQPIIRLYATHIPIKGYCALPCFQTRRFYW
jgi:hypothetical protein